MEEGNKIQGVDTRPKSTCRMWEKIQKNERLQLKEGNKIQGLEASKEEYIAAVRSSLASTKVFIKRKTHEIRINNYNQVLFRCWRANMDIQYVIDPYSCAVYIVTYIAKAQTGMSILLMNAAKEVREGNLDIRRQVRDLLVTSFWPMWKCQHRKLYTLSYSSH